MTTFHFRALRSLSFSTAFLILATNLFAQTKPESFEERSKLIQESLSNLGFDDISSRIRAELKARPTGDQDIDDNREWNAKRYEVKNSARRLAARIYLRLNEIKELEGHQKQKAESDIIELICQLAALQPFDFDPRVPKQYLAVPKSQLEESYRSYQEPIMAEKAYRHSATMAANFIDRLYGEEAVKDYFDRVFKDGELSSPDLETAKTMAAIQKDVSTIVNFAWTDSTMGQVRFAGQAAALAADIFVRENPRYHDGFLNRLKERLEQYGYYWENFVGDKPVVKNQIGEKVHLGPIVTGDSAFERTTEHEADQITGSVVPHRGRTWLAWRLGLINPIRAMFYQLIDPNTIPEKSWWKRPILYALYRMGERFSKLPSASRGISHYGSFVRLEDPRTGAVALKVRDMYPMGIRDMDFVYSFGEQGMMMRIGYSHENPEKVYAWFHEQCEARRKKYGNSYIEAIWPSDLEHLDEHGKIIKGHEHLVKFPVKIAEEKFHWLESIEDPKVLAGELYNLTMNHIYDDYLVKQGLDFQYGFGEGYYCASTRCIASMVAAGYDPERAPDRFRWLLRMLNKISNLPGFKKIDKLEDVREMDMGKRIVGPNGLVINDNVDEKDVHSVTYERMTTQERFESMTEPEQNPLNHDTKRLWEDNRGNVYRRLKQHGAQEVEFGDDFDDTLAEVRDGFTRTTLKHAKGRQGLLGKPQVGRVQSPMDRCVRALRRIQNRAEKEVLGI